MATNPDSLSLEFLRQRVANLTEEMDHLKSEGGGGTSGGMDPWQSSVETRLGQLHTGIEGLRSDLNTKFLWLLGAIAASFVAIAGLYFYLDSRVEPLNDKIVAVQIQQSEVNGKIDTLLERTPAKR